MPRGKKELAEQIIPKLREVEVEVGRGKTVAVPTRNGWPALYAAATVGALEVPGNVRVWFVWFTCTMPETAL